MFSSRPVASSTFQCPLPISHHVISESGVVRTEHIQLFHVVCPRPEFEMTRLLVERVHRDVNLARALQQRRRHPLHGAVPVHNGVCLGKNVDRRSAVINTG